MVDRPIRTPRPMQPHMSHIHTRTLATAQALTLLGRFISVKEPNIRYLGLEALGRFAQLEQLGDGGLESIKKHQATVFVSLKASKQSKAKQAARDDGPAAFRASSTDTIRG